MGKHLWSFEIFGNQTDTCPESCQKPDK